MIEKPRHMPEIISFYHAGVRDEFCDPIETERVIATLEARILELEKALKRLVNKGSGCDWKDWEAALVALHGPTEKQPEDLSYERAIVATTFVPVKKGQQ